MSLINSNSFLYKTVNGVKQSFSPLINASTVVLEDGSKLEKGGKVYADQAVNAGMLGGKAPQYYIQPRNLLDNSDFRNPVNQRGRTSYTAAGYSIDRWMIAGTAPSLTISDKGITVSGDTYLQQRFVTGRYDTAKTYTAAVYYMDGTAGVSNARIKTSSGGFDFINVYPTANKTIKSVAIYEGAYTAETLPPYVPKGYAVELAECFRYLYVFENSVVRYKNTQITPTILDFTIPMPAKMRVIPTITGNVTIYKTTGTNATAISGLSVAINATNKNALNIRVIGSHGVTESAMLDVAAGCIFSAEL